MAMFALNTICLSCVSSIYGHFTIVHDTSSLSEWQFFLYSGRGRLHIEINVLNRPPSSPCCGPHARHARCIPGCWNCWICGLELDSSNIRRSKTHISVLPSKIFEESNSWRLTRFILSSSVVLRADWALLPCPAGHPRPWPQPRGPWWIVSWLLMFREVREPNQILDVVLLIT